MIKSELFFGRDVVWPDKTKDYVCDIGWSTFLEESVDNRFDGYTWFNSFGCYQGQCEDSICLVILHEKTYDDAQKIAAIIQDFKDLYNQDSVLLITTEVRSNLDGTA